MNKININNYMQSVFNGLFGKGVQGDMISIQDAFRRFQMQNMVNKQNIDLSQSSKSQLKTIKEGQDILKNILGKK